MADYGPLSACGAKVMAAGGLRKTECLVWTPTLKALHREFWLSHIGFSTRDIAALLGTTKNAVIGAARRFDLPPRPNAIVRKLTDEQIAALLAARREGIHPRTMRQTLGLSAKQVAYWYDKRGPWKPRPVELPYAR
jgi:hypothetical protein